MVGLPNSGDNDASEESWETYFKKTIVGMMRPERLETRLPVMCRDTQVFCDELDAQLPTKGWGVTQPFESIPKLLFQLPARVVGATELAEDEKLLKKSMAIFDTFEKCNSPFSVVFPWLRVFTPSYIVRITMAIKLYRIFSNIVSTRNKTGRREEDGLQVLIDQNVPMDIILKVKCPQTTQSST